MSLQKVPQVPFTHESLYHQKQGWGVAIYGCNKGGEVLLFHCPIITRRAFIQTLAHFLLSLSLVECQWCLDTSALIWQGPQERQGSLREVRRHGCDHFQCLSHPLIPSSNQGFRWTLQQTNSNNSQHLLKPIQVLPLLEADQSNGSSLPTMEHLVDTRESHGSQGTI